MTTQELNSFKRRIRKLGDKWLQTLGFRHWTVQYCWELHPCKENEDCVAKCDAQWEYLAMCLTFYVSKLLDYSDAELEEIFVHECCHGLVNEMRMWGPTVMETEKRYEAAKHEERVTSILTRAFLWTRHDGEKSAQKKRKSK